jgi:AraC-like DNA-binding protein
MDLDRPTPALVSGDTLGAGVGRRYAQGAGPFARYAGIASTFVDSILDVLHTTRLTGGIFLDAEFTAPWCVAAQIGPEDCTPFTPQPVNIVAYHYVSAGRMLLLIDGQPPVPVDAGEIVVLPRNDPHRIGSNLGLPPVSGDTLIQPAADGGIARIRYGGRGERVHVWCGFLGNNTPNDPLLRILPPVLKVPVTDGASGGWIESSLAFAARELAADRVRSPELLARLAELLFMEAVRRYVASLPDGQRGWHAGVRDPVVARALALLHGCMQQRWTAEILAREVGLSRSALAERFTRIMGEPPIRYLARQRLQLAAQRLRTSAESIPRVAFSVGYESEAAFNRAFKREFGVPPAAWRKQNVERPGG